MSNRAKKILESLLKRRQGRVYFIGIKGVGMSGLAQILRHYGLEVLGSDTREQFWTDQVLKRRQMLFFEGFSKKNIPKRVDLVVVSEAYYTSQIPNRLLRRSSFGYEGRAKSQAINPEVRELLRRKLPVLTYPEALSVVFNQAEMPVAVAGTHGKSTTVAMLGEILEAAGLEPTVLLGAENLNWKSNVRLPAPITDYRLPITDTMVIEADEWQKNAFSSYQPKLLLITNIDWDHPDHFPTPKEYFKQFDNIIRHTREKVFNLQLSNAKRLEKLPYNFSLKVPGQHNQANAWAAAQAAEYLGVPRNTIQRALENFKGLRRRFEIIGHWQGKVPLIDDYAHHPTELRALLAACQEAYPDREPILAFQPHTFSRTEKLFDGFRTVLSKAPGPVLLVKTYGSAREQAGVEWALNLKQALAQQGKPAFYFNSHHELQAFLAPNITQNNIVVFAGAGDLWQVAQSLLKKS